MIGGGLGGEARGMWGGMAGDVTQVTNSLVLACNVCYGMDASSHQRSQKRRKQMRLILTITNKQGVEVSITWMGFDVVHTDGRVTLGPTRIDGKALVEIPAARVIRFECGECRHVFSKQSGCCLLCDTPEANEAVNR